ncbi:helicase [Mycoemilia scoparia]|uniref:RNA helicase n=1 Tax=Mycoemilia scoparia TaxID=417184 RepID=A0A9W8A6L2_9FUNG|nr:helicase [Mycoemilia scoparia]
MRAHYTTSLAIENAHEDGIWSVCWSKDGSSIITGSNDETIKIWNSNTGEVMGQLLDGSYAITSLDISADGKSVLSTHMDNQIRIWSLERLNLKRSIKVGPVKAWTAKFTKDGERIVSGTDKGTVLMWSTDSEEAIREYDTTRGRFASCVAVSHDNKLIACGSDNGMVHIFDIESGKIMQALMAHSSTVRSLSFSPSSTLIFSSSDDKCIQAYDVKSGNNIMSLTGHAGCVFSVAPHPSLEVIASGSLDKEVKLWDLREKDVIDTFNTHSDSVWSLDWEPSDHSRLVSAGDDGMVQFYDPLAFPGKKGKTSNQTNSRQDKEKSNKKFEPSYWDNAKVKDPKDDTQKKPQQPKDLFSRWTGKTPVTLLSEYCQRSKWERPNYIPRHKANRVYCIVELSKKSKKTSNVQKVTMHPVATDKFPLNYEFLNEARHVAATYALHRMQSGKNMRSVIPPHFRDYWDGLDKIKAEEGERSSWKYETDPFAALIELEKKKTAKKERIEKEEEKRAEIKKSGNLIRLLPLRSYNAWESLPEVHMNESFRNNVEEIVKKWLKEWHISSDTNGGVTNSSPSSTKNSSIDPIKKDIVAMGFNPFHVAEALKCVDSKEKAIDWLCIHIPEMDLPQRFLNRAYKPGITIISRNSAEKVIIEKAAKRIVRLGFSTSISTPLFTEEFDSISSKYENPVDHFSKNISDYEARIVSKLVSKLCYLETPFESGLDGDIASLKQTLGDELMALAAICGEDNVIQTNFPNIVGVKLDLGPGLPLHALLEFWLPSCSKYPSEHPVVTFTADALPVYVQLSVTSRLNDTIRKQVFLGEQMMYDIVNLTQEKAVELINCPPPLSQLMGGLLGENTAKSSAPDNTDNYLDEPLLPTPGSGSGSMANSSPNPDPKKLLIEIASPRIGVELANHFMSLQLKQEYTQMLERRKQLPAWSYRDEIVQAIANNRCVIISGATGCGKTTQVPQFVLDSFLSSNNGHEANIICTQPRRISAISVASRVVEERSDRTQRIGDLVGYAVRGQSRQKAGKTRLLFSTTGVLLRMLQDNPDLEGVSHVIVDEVHERSTDSDLLLIMLREILERNKNPNIRIVLMSATVDTGPFIEYFAQKINNNDDDRSEVPVLSIPGRTFPVSDIYMDEIVPKIGYKALISTDKKLKQQVMNTISNLDNDMNSKLVNRYMSEQQMTREDAVALVAWDNMFGTEASATKIDNNVIAEVVKTIDKENPKDQAVLIFMPGAGEIQACINFLKSSDPEILKGCHILPLHAGLTPNEQNLVFAHPPKGKRKIVVSTNVAETSITIEDIVFVIETGRVKENRYDPNNRLCKLTSTFCSKAAAKQRRGRAGRVKSGICYHIYSRDTMQNVMPDYGLPEILRVPLEQICLRIKALGYTDSVDFLSKALDPPSIESINAAESLLLLMSAQTSYKGSLTPLGNLMALIPVDLKLAKMLIYGVMFDCIWPTITIAACMTTGSPFKASADNIQDMRAAKKKYYNNKSDLLTELKLYEEWEAFREEKSANKPSVSQFIRDSFLSRTVLIEIRRGMTAILDALKTASLVPESTTISSLKSHYMKNKSSPKLLKSVIFAGLFPHIAKIKMPRQKYEKVMDGTVELENEAKDVRFFSIDFDAQSTTANTSIDLNSTKTKSKWLDALYRDMRVFIHPQSMVFDETQFKSPFLTYFIRTASAQTGKVHLRDATVIGLYSVLFFGPSLHVDHDYQTISVGKNAIFFRSWPRIGVLVTYLRQLLDELLSRRLADPSIDISTHPVVKIVTDLIVSDGI